jgi:soluble cytochrome b562
LALGKLAELLHRPDKRQVLIFSFSVKTLHILAYMMKTVPVSRWINKRTQEAHPPAAASVSASSAVPESSPEGCPNNLEFEDQTEGKPKTIEDVDECKKKASSSSSKAEAEEVVCRDHLDYYDDEAKGPPMMEYDPLLFTGDASADERESMISAFQASEDKVMLLSSKAGGTGLTLTAASDVFIMEPWWHPFIDPQLIARAHRNGQTREVHTYRFTVASNHSIDKWILGLQQQKLMEAISIIPDFNRYSDSFVANGKQMNLVDSFCKWVQAWCEEYAEDAPKKARLKQQLEKSENRHYGQYHFDGNNELKHPAPLDAKKKATKRKTAAAAAALQEAAEPKIIKNHNNLPECFNDDNNEPGLLLVDDEKQKKNKKKSALVLEQERMFAEFEAVKMQSTKRFKKNANGDFVACTIDNNHHDNHDDADGHRMWPCPRCTCANEWRSPFCEACNLKRPVT